MKRSLKISLLIVGKGRRKPSYFRLTRQYEDSPSCGNLQSFILLRLNVNRGHVEHLKPSNLVCLEWRTHNIKLDKRKWNRARFDVLTAVLIKTAVFWDVTPCWVARGPRCSLYRRALHTESAVSGEEVTRSRRIDGDARLKRHRRHPLSLYVLQALLIVTRRTTQHSNLSTEQNSWPQELWYLQINVFGEDSGVDVCKVTSP